MAVYLLRKTECDYGTEVVISQYRSLQTARHELVLYPDQVLVTKREATIVYEHADPTLRLWYRPR